MRSVNRVSGGGNTHVIGQTVELIGQHKEGYQIPIELSISMWMTDSGYCYGGIIRDIRERKAIELAQKESSDRLENILYTANDTIITANAEGKIITWNKAAERTFGYAQEEVLGQSLSIIVPDRFKEAHDKGRV